MRGLLVAVALGLVVLVGGPAARAADPVDADYPPGTPGVGIPNRPAMPEGAAGLPSTGADLGRELALGAGLVVAGGSILVVTRRRRAARP